MQYCMRSHEYPFPYPCAPSTPINPDVWELKPPNSPLQFELDDAPAIEALLSAYPEPVKVADLPHPPTEDLDDKVSAPASDGICLRIAWCSALVS